MKYFFIDIYIFLYHFLFYNSQLFSQNNSSNDGLSISLPKDTFLMYEPILVKLRFINKSNEIDTVYGMFSELGDTRYILKNEKGVIIKEIGFGMDFIRDPSFFLMPGDTIATSLVLTKTYGNLFKLNDEYFGFSSAYLNPGKYRTKLDLFDKNDFLN